MTTSSQASEVVPARPEAVFGALTDIARLPEWNAAMTSVIDQPDHLEAGAEWVVEFNVLGQTWRSRSTLEELVRTAAGSPTDPALTTATPPTHDGHGRSATIPLGAG